MRVLVGCEYSGRVRDVFTRKGHYAVSCDLEDTEARGLHYKGDIFDILYDKWDLLIAHPPCTHLCVSGARWFKTKGVAKQEEALIFVWRLMQAPIEKIAIENPVGVISTKIRKPDQIVHPWWFGDPSSKATCLWLKNLPLLVKTNPSVMKYQNTARTPPSENRGKIRSLISQNMAQAFADQWG